MYLFPRVNVSKKILGKVFQGPHIARKSTLWREKKIGGALFLKYWSHPNLADTENFLGALGTQKSARASKEKREKMCKNTTFL